MPAPTRRPGFSILDLVVVTALVAVGSVAVFAAAEAADKHDLRVSCATNLRVIAQAVHMYANENNGHLPRTRFSGDDVPKLVAYTNATTKDPWAEDGPGPNDVTAPMYLLLRTQDINSDVFVCPETDAPRLWFGKDKADAGDQKVELVAATTRDLSNFPDGRSLSYSLACGYPSEAARTAGFVYTVALPAEFPMVADMNPGAAAQAGVTAKSPKAEVEKANSRNHGGAGQNVAYMDGHVEWYATPFAGAMRPDQTRDNIYAPQGWTYDAEKSDPLLGPPTDNLDSVLLPTADYEAAGKEKDGPEEKGAAAEAKK